MRPCAASRGVIEASLILFGLLHPSRANAERIAFIAGGGARGDLSSNTIRVVGFAADGDAALEGTEPGTRSAVTGELVIEVSDDPHRELRAEMLHRRPLFCVWGSCRPERRLLGLAHSPAAPSQAKTLPQFLAGWGEQREEPVEHGSEAQGRGKHAEKLAHSRLAVAS
jgi:hypothetical protein